MKIYIACSFAYKDRVKTSIRKETMEKCENILKNRGFEIYNPSKLKIPNAWDYSMWDWGKMVFDADRAEIDTSDMVVFISYGKENNAGSVWEVGYAYAKNIPVIMISMNKDCPESLMLIHSAHTCLESLDQLKTYDFNSLPKYQIERVES